jgi:hypothetical protein
MPLNIRDIVERCRRLALLARHAGTREELIRLADDMERDAGAFERKEATQTDRLAG